MSINNYNKYCLCAIKAVELNTTSLTPNELWEQAAASIFDSKSSQEKSCPKAAFLGLCEEGLVKGIPKGEYTKSVKNKNYALQAIKLLKSDKSSSYSPIELWVKLELGDKSHNSQMEVVLALWENELIVG